jgi:hypothetical protein
MALSARTHRATATVAGGEAAGVAHKLGKAIATYPAEQILHQAEADAAARWRRDEPLATSWR